MTSEVITWNEWTASYTPEEKKLVPKNRAEAEFIHELKARFDGVLTDGRAAFPIPERVRLELDLRKDAA